MFSIILVISIFLTAFQFIQDHVIYQHYKKEEASTARPCSTALAFDSERFGLCFTWTATDNTPGISQSPFQRQKIFTEDQSSHGGRRRSLPMEVLLLFPSEQKDDEQLPSLQISLVDWNQTRCATTQFFPEAIKLGSMATAVMATPE